jgi:voltage-gated potassium channel
MVAAWLAVTTLAAIGMYIAEHGVNPAFDDPVDAIWWSVVTLSTVGYGDVFPLTPEGRVAAMLLMILGIGLYSAITAAVTSYFVTQGAARNSMVDDLDRLTTLHAGGALTDDEFRAAKASILGGPET